MSVASRIFYRGETYDYECSRTSNRMQGALRILKSQGAEPTYSHSDRKVWDRPTNREVHVCDHVCSVTWPAWVTLDLVEKAYATASALIAARGSHHVNAASRAATERRHALKEVPR